MKNKKPTVQQLAKRWSRSTRSTQDMLKTGVPLHDDEATVKWFYSQSNATQRKLGAPFVRKVHEARMAHSPSPAPQKPQDGQESATKGNATPMPDGEYLTGLKLLRDGEYKDLQVATTERNAIAVADCTRQLENLSGLVAQEELRAFKLGREMGEIMQRSEAEQFARAEKYWRLRLVDHVLATVVPKLIAAQARQPTLDRDIIVGIIEPELLDQQLVKPLAQALRTTSAMKLPAWYIDAQREALADLVEPDAPPNGTPVS